MERGKKNRVKNKFRMSSPFTQTSNLGDAFQKGLSGRVDPGDPNYVGDINSVDNTNTSSSESTTSTEPSLTELMNKYIKNTGAVTPPVNGDNPPAESTDQEETVKEKGIDRWIDKPIMDVLGLSKKARTARKERKAQKIADAKTAEGEGTETLKQAKLVKRAKKREDRALKRKIKDQKKLKKFREKNPVTGTEAINLVTDGGNKSLV